MALLVRHLVVIGNTGRRTGRRHEVPVTAAPHGDGLVVLVGGAAGTTWWRSLDGDVTIRRGGREESCRARLVRAGEPGREHAVATHLGAFPRVAVSPEDPLVVLERVPSSSPSRAAR